LKNLRKHYTTRIKQEPIKGEHFLNNSEIYRVVGINRAHDSVLLRKLSDGKNYETRFDTFSVGFEQVWKIGEVADFLGRSPRSLYRYEHRGQTEKPKRFKTVHGPELRFYTKQDVLDIHDLIAGVHQGRPRKDNKIINNTLPTRSELLIMFRERFKA
jgi:hypothetical protein